MSNLATERLLPSRRLSLAAFALALSAAATWVLAATADDALYVVVGALGISAVAVGGKARADATRAGSKDRLALAAIVIGGLLAALVLAFTVVWAITEVV